MKYLYWISLIASIMFIGCSESKFGKDGYKFDEREYKKSEMLVKLVEFKSDRDFKRIALEAGIKDARAFAELRESSCTIYMVKPELKYQPEQLGHEITHCFYGKFHKESEAIR